MLFTTALKFSSVSGISPPAIIVDVEGVCGVCDVEAIGFGDGGEGGAGVCTSLPLSDKDISDDVQ